MPYRTAAAGSSGSNSSTHSAHSTLHLHLHPSALATTELSHEAHEQNAGRPPEACLQILPQHLLNRLLQVDHVSCYQTCCPLVPHALTQDVSEGVSVEADLEAGCKAIDNADLEFSRYGDTLFEVCDWHMCILMHLAWCM